MGYIGNTPAEKYSSLTQQTFSSPTGTSFTLDQAVTSSVDIALFIDNVRQDPTTYTASGTSLTTSTISSPSTMYCLFNGKTTGTVAPPANSVDSGSVVSGAIDDSHITGMVASKLTGVVAPANLGTGTASASTFLNGAGAYAVAGGGAWNLIGTAVASASASLDIIGLDSTYDTYAIALSDIVNASDGQPIVIRMGDSGGFDSGATDYAYVQIKHRAGSQSASGGGNATIAYIMIDNDPGNAVAGEGMGAIFYLHRPGDGTTYPTITGHATGMNINTDLTQFIFTGARLAVIALDRIQVLALSGNITSGRMTVWGISHS